MWFCSNTKLLLCSRQPGAGRYYDIFHPMFASLQSMACAHRRYFPPKIFAHQVDLGVAVKMGVVRVWSY